MAERASPRRLLMIAYHFPPLQGSSGIQRTLRFVQHLPRFGWQPIVLTAHPRAYERTSDDQMADVPEGTQVRRSFALDAARHLAIGGRYPAAFAIPDRWSSWRFGAIADGMSMIRRYRPDAIWSTYPIATAHVIGARLAHRSGLPWIADFRDPMAQDGYPADARTWQAFSRIEDRALHESAAAVFTTPSCLALYRDRYRDVPSSRSVLIENGYDEETFARAEHERRDEPKTRGTARITLLHSGIVYPSERDPTALFDALGTLKQSGRLDAARFLLRFRASAHDDLLKRLAKANDVEDLVEIAPAMPYHAALREMLSVDALLILQAANCNEQIPAKLYEYVRARRPVFALTDRAGDTAKTLMAAGLGSIAPLDDAGAIADALVAFVGRVSMGGGDVATDAVVASCSREGRTRQLVELLERVV